MITLEWADTTKEEMVGNKITIKAPWDSTSKKLLYFNCKDSKGTPLAVNVDKNFIDESGSFTNSDILSNDTGTRILRLASNSSVSVGEYKIAVKYHPEKQITAIIKIANTLNIRYYPYIVDDVVSNDIYILSTAYSITVSDEDDVFHMKSHGGIEWVSVRYIESSDTPYKFIDCAVYNKDCLSYTSISDKPTSGRNLRWGTTIYILAYSSLNHEFNAVGKGFEFAKGGWDMLFPEKTL